LVQPLNARPRVLKWLVPHTLRNPRRGFWNTLTRRNLAHAPQIADQIRTDEKDVLRSSSYFDTARAALSTISATSLGCDTVPEDDVSREHLEDEDSDEYVA
jgi:hypothetical protein